ncbi:MAG: hypothetical protein R3A13_10490 [Bdellovibrionota bacterium]
MKYLYSIFFIFISLIFQQENANALEWLKTGINVYQTTDGFNKLVVSPAGVLFVELHKSGDLQNFHLEHLKKDLVRNHAFFAFNGEQYDAFITEARRYSISEQAGFTMNLSKFVRVRVNNLIPGMTIIAREKSSAKEEAIIFLRGYDVAYRGSGKKAVMLIEGSAKYREVAKPYSFLTNGIVYLESGGKRASVRSGNLGILQEPSTHPCLSSNVIFLDEVGVKDLQSVRQTSKTNKKQSLQKLAELLKTAKSKANPIDGSIILQVVDNSLILFDYTVKPEQVKFVDFLGDASGQALCSVEKFEL